MRGRVRSILVAALLAGGGSAARADCSLTRLADLPVTMQGLKPLVDAKINGHDVRFIADSGAFYSLISPSVAAELKLGLVPVPPNFNLGGIGGSYQASLTTVKAFAVGGATINAVQFLVGGSDVGNAGLLGQNVLGFRDAEYDLGGGMIRLLRAQGCTAPQLAYWVPAGTTINVLKLEPRDAMDPHIVANVKVNGITMRAVFDTGASTSSLTLAAAARAGVHPTDPGVRPAGFASGLGTRLLRSWTAPFASVAIGDEEIKQVRLRIADNPDARYDLLLGADFFLSHHVYVANALQRLIFTYKGGPVFDLTPHAALASAAAAGAGASGAGTAGPAGDAGALGREASALLARRDYAGALALLDRAVAAAPDDAALAAERGRAHLALRQPLLAAQDLDRSLTLDPAQTEARILRAQLRLAGNDAAGARADVDAVAARIAPQANLRLGLASLYSRLDLPEQAIGQYDLWLAAHAEDAERPVALNGRCWSRALLGRELPAALKDCDAAVRARPGWAQPLDSRGLVRLRQGEYARAIADYDAALKLQPRAAWSLYGRGLAERATGDKASGDADVAAATALAPRLPEQARAHGIAPAG